MHCPAPCGVWILEECFVSEGLLFALMWACKWSAPDQPRVRGFCRRIAEGCLMVSVAFKQRCLSCCRGESGGGVSLRFPAGDARHEECKAEVPAA